MCEEDWHEQNVQGRVWIDDEQNNQGHLTRESVIAVKGGEVWARSVEKSTQSIELRETNGRHCFTRFICY